MLVRGQIYTRTQISAELGGCTLEYLPRVKGKIVCACLLPDPNPDSLGFVLPGSDESIQKLAQALCAQCGPVPVFVKRKSHKWEYVGDYVVEEYSQAPAKGGASIGQPGYLHEGIFPLNHVFSGTDVWCRLSDTTGR